jgi:4-amino-4-deoxy-L-arabinose transferase-like glycosyltransferase
MLSKNVNDKIFVNEAPKEKKYNRIKIRQRQPEIWLVGFIFLGALALRFYNLTTNSLWFDETYNVYFIKNLAFIDAITFFRNYLVHPPLFLGLMNLWIGATGYTELSLRLFALIFGVAMLPLIYLICRSWLNNKIAILALLLVSLSPIQIFWSQYIRPYSFFNFAVVSSCSLAFFATRKPDKIWRWLIYTLSTTMMLYIHYLAFHVILMQVIFFGIIFWKQWRHLFYAFVSLALVGVSFLAWLDRFLQHSRFFGDSLEYLANGGLSKLFSLLPLFSSWFVPPTLLFVTGAIFLPFYLLGLVWLWQKHRQFALLLTLWSILPAITCWLSSFISPNFAPQRVSFSQPAFLIIVASGIWSLLDKEYKPIKPRLAWGGLALMVILNLFSLLNYYQNYQTQDWRGMVNRIVAEYQPGDAVFLADQVGDTIGSFDFYYVNNLGSPKNIPRILPVYVNTFRPGKPNSLTLQEINSYQRVWVIRWNLPGRVVWYEKNILPNFQANFNLVEATQQTNTEQGLIEFFLFAKK